MGRDHRHERSEADFSRTVALPVQIDVADVVARLEDGILEVRAHRRPTLQKVHVHVRARGA